MALSSTATSMCNQLVQKYNGLIDPVKAAKSSFKSLTRTLASQLSTAIYSPLSSLQTEMNALQDRVNGIIPGIDDEAMGDIEDFLINCPIFGQSTPVSAVGGTTNGIFDEIDKYIDDSYALFEEFGLANLADTINKLLNGTGYPGGSNLSGLLKDGGILIQCLSSLCPGFEPIVISYTDDLNSLYDEMHIVSNPVDPNFGLLDYDYLYSTANMTPTQITNMNYTISGVTDIKSNALSSVNASKQAVKNTLNTGSLF
jgi:hypothetical protein